MTMDLSLSIEGDSGNAQAALDSLSGKLGDLQGAIDSVDPSALDATQSALDNVAASGDTAATGLEDASAASDDAATGLSDAGAAASDAGSGLSDAGSAASDASGGLSDAGSAAGEASGGLSDAGAAASEASGGIGDLTGAVGGLDPSLGTLTGSIGGVVEGLGEGGLAGGAVAATAAVAALGMAGESFAQQQMKIQDVLGMSADQAETYTYALSDVGSSGDRLITMGYMLEKRLEAANLQMASGKSVANPLTLTMDALGISWRDASGNMLSMGDILPQLFEKLGTMTDKSQIAALATQLFGKAGADMIPYLMNYGQVMGNVAGQVDKAGMSQKDMTQLTIDAKTAQTNLTIEVDKLGVEALPVLTAALEVGDKSIGPFIEDIATLDKGIGKLNSDSGGQLTKWMGDVFHSIGEGTPLVGSLAGTFGALNTLLGDTKGKTDDAATAQDGLATAEGDSVAPTQASTSKFLDQYKALTDLNTAVGDLDKALQGLGTVETAEEASIKATSSTLDANIKTREAFVAGGGVLTAEQATELQSWKDAKVAVDAEGSAIAARKQAAVDNVEAIQAGRPTELTLIGDINDSAASYQQWAKDAQGTTDVINGTNFAEAQTTYDNLITKFGAAGSAYGDFASGMQSSSAAIDRIDFPDLEAALGNLGAAAHAAYLEFLNLQIAADNATAGHAGGMASGGVTERSGVFTVGEAGIEQVWLPQGARVFNHQETLAMQSGASGGSSVPTGGVVNNIHIDHVDARSADEAKQAASTLGYSLQRNMRSRGIA